MFDLILIGIGASIGAGIFVVTGTVARDAGPGASLLLSSSKTWFFLFLFRRLCFLSFLNNLIVKVDKILLTGANHLYKDAK